MLPYRRSTTMNITERIAQQVAEGTITSTAPEELSGYTPYQVGKVLAETYATVGITTVVQPQYVYNLARSGKIDGIKGSTTGRRFTEEQVEEFVTKMVARNLPKA